MTNPNLPAWREAVVDTLPEAVVEKISDILALNPEALTTVMELPYPEDHRIAIVTQDNQVISTFDLRD